MTESSPQNTVLEQQLEDLFLKYAPKLIPVANRILGNREDAEDTVNDVFVNLKEGPPPKAFIKNPPGYLHNAVVNTALNALRARRTRTALERKACEQNDTAPAVRSRAQVDLHRRLMDAKSRMELGDVALLTLRYELDLSCAEIAQFLGRTRAGVGMSLARARRRMKTLMIESDPSRQQLTKLTPTPGESQ